jgi:hypothetical protein
MKSQTTSIDNQIDRLFARVEKLEKIVLTNGYDAYESEIIERRLAEFDRPDTGIQRKAIEISIEDTKKVADEFVDWMEDHMEITKAGIRVGTYEVDDIKSDAFIKVDWPLRFEFKTACQF